MKPNIRHKMQTLVEPFSSRNSCLAVGLVRKKEKDLRDAALIIVSLCCFIIKVRGAPVFSSLFIFARSRY